MISFVRSSQAQQTVARRNNGVQERRARLMQLGERAYLYQEFQRHRGRSRLCLATLPETELRRYLADAIEASSSSAPPTRDDLEYAFAEFAKTIHVNGNATIHTLEISQRVQDLLESVNREALLNMLNGLANLRHFSMGTTTVEILRRLEANCDKIESLHTGCFHVTAPEGEPVMVELLSRWNSLKSIVWETASYRRAAQIDMISRTVPALPRLEKIRLMHSGLKEFHPFEALRFVELCPQLRELVLSNWKLTMAACTILGDGVARHQSLEKLELSRCEIYAGGWQDLVTALQTNASVRNFSIRESRIVRGHGAGTYPSRLVRESLAVLLQDYNHTLEHVENESSTQRVWRLLELNRSGYRQQLPNPKLGPRILAMASSSPRFVYSLLRNNVETLLVRAASAR